MKKLVLIRFLCIYLACIAQPYLVAAQDDVSVCKQISDISGFELRAAERLKTARIATTTASKDIDLHYHRCDWYVDPAVNAIYGSVTSGFTARMSLNTVYFDLRANMIVDSVLRRGTRLPVSRAGDSVAISLPALLNAGAYDSLTIYYHGAPETSGFGSFVVASHDGVPALFTLSEPYGAKDWWPCKNSVDDKIDSLDVIIRCPSAYLGVSNGLHLATVARGDTTITSWKHRYPVSSYLIAMAVTNYQRFERKVQLGSVSLPMETFCYPESLDDFQNRTQSTLDALQLFHHLFGPYPFIKEKYGHTQFAWKGGQEHQTNSFVKEPDESLCAHELAHQWFGDKVTCGAFSDIWLNEGFATHAASLFMELKHPERTYDNRRVEIERITSDPAGAVYVVDTTNLSRIFDARLSYLKGSHLLYMLRVQLGDERFWEGVRQYLEDPRLSYGYARTNDLKRHLETAGTCSLDSFFRQWVYGEGYPSYQVEWTQIGGATVRFRIGQTTSHSSVKLFQLKVPIRFYGHGKDTTLFADHNSNGQIFIQDIGFIADSAAVDPDLWLISKANTVRKNDSLGRPDRQVVLYPNPFQDELRVMLTDFPGSAGSLALYAENGSCIYRQALQLYQGRGFVRIDSRGFSAGNYVLLITDELGKKVSRLTVHL